MPVARRSPPRSSRSTTWNRNPASSSTRCHPISRSERGARSARAQKERSMPQASDDAKRSEIPLRAKFNHDTDAAVLAEHPQIWDGYRQESRAFRSTAAPGDWTVWYLLGFEDVREAFQ